MIPQKIHYFFGLDQGFNKKPFSLYHYLNIKSAKLRNPSYEIKVHYKYDPENEYFDLLDSFCTKVKLNELPEELAGKRIEHTEHLCDYLRLKTLYKEGGIYLDTDVVCVKSFDNLLGHQAAMAEEYGTLLACHPDFVQRVIETRGRTGEEEELIGLCNAAILSRAGNEFIKTWINEYHNNYNTIWNWTCILRPYEIAGELPTHVTKLDRSTFVKYSWTPSGFENLFRKTANIDDCYGLHLWASINYKLLELYNDRNDEIWKTDCTITNIYCKLLEETI